LSVMVQRLVQEMHAAGTGALAVISSDLGLAWRHMLCHGHMYIS
jgi:hypothetical protein